MKKHASVSRPSSESLPTVAIIGRPNVGKSTLFNKVLGIKNTIVDDTPGVTRDRIYAECDYQGHLFQLVDTGGFDPSATEGMVGLIKQQSQVAVSQSEILILVMDGRAGLTALDEEIISFLRGTKKPIFYAINKIDTPKSEALLADFYKLGQNHLYPISAEHGMGVDELLEAFLPLLPTQETDTNDTLFPKVAIVGRPNVGKSTLINTMVGQERMVVSTIPGTTRDAVDSIITFGNRHYLFTDTAGLRRRGRVERGIEGYSVAKTIRALGRSDIAVLLLDGTEGVTEQDTKIAGLILKQGRGCIILINKWDLRKGEADAQMKYSQMLHRRFPFLQFVSILYGSALKEKTLQQLFPLIDRVGREFSKRVSTGKLNQFLQKAIAANPLPLRKGSPVKSVFMTQVATNPPTFALFVGRNIEVTSTYLRFLENRIRETFGFEGTPIRILVRKK